MDKTNRTLAPASPMPEPIAPAAIDDDFIKSRILTIRGVQVMLDRDLAEIYGVSTSRLNEQVKRNIGRFPASFAFRLSRTELDDLKSQNATSSWGGVRKPSNAFTEHGIIMQASVLKSDAAVATGVRAGESGAGGVS